MLDENLFRFTDGYPLLVSEVAKQQLSRALWNDTLFLASINVMDYSLLVGLVQPDSGVAGSGGGGGGGAGAAGGGAVVVATAGTPADEAARDQTQGWTLVVGLIDYCRQYTWKEEAESRVKRATVVHPKQYKKRFRESLHRYFMPSIEKYVL